MLKFIRNNKAANWVKVLFGVLTAVFIFWGVGIGLGGTQAQYVADVNGELIEDIEFQRAYRNLDRIYREIYKSNPAMMEGLDLRGQAVEQLVRVTLLRQEAERLGLGVADSEVRDTIAADTNFQVDGRFDKDRYLRVLRLNLLTPGQYEDSQRREILVEKVATLVGGGVRVSTAEARDNFLRTNEKINLSYVALDAADFSEGIEVSDAEAETYFKDHAEEFRQPDRVRLDYVLFPTTSFEEGASVTDAEIQAYYDANKSTFEEPEQVRARHILIRVPNDGDDAAKAAARAKVEGLLTRVKAGEDFSELAKSNSEDESNAPRGGDLGFFPRGRMVPPFEDAAFALQPGETSGIVETGFGLHLIKVEERRAAGARPFADVKGEIDEKLRREAGKKAAEKAANDARDKANGGTSLQDLASAAGQTVRSTAPVGRGETIPGLNGSTTLIDAALPLAAGELGPVTFTADGYFVFRVSDKVASHLPELNAVADKVRDAVRLEKAGAKAKERAEELRAKIAGSSLQQVAEAEKLEVKETGPLARSGGWLPGLGVSTELKEAGFALTADAPVAPAVYSVGSKQIVAALKERITPADEEFETQKDDLVRQLETVRRNEVMTNFFEELKSRASIEMGSAYRDLLG